MTLTTQQQPAQPVVQSTWQQTDVATIFSWIWWFFLMYMSYSLFFIPHMVYYSWQQFKKYSIDHWNFWGGGHRLAIMTGEELQKKRWCHTTHTFSAPARASFFCRTDRGHDIHDHRGRTSPSQPPQKSHVVNGQAPYRTLMDPDDFLDRAAVEDFICVLCLSVQDNPTSMGCAEGEPETAE